MRTKHNVFYLTFEEILAYLKNMCPNFKHHGLGRFFLLEIFFVAGLGMASQLLRSVLFSRADGGSILSCWNKISLWKEERLINERFFFNVHC